MAVLTWYARVELLAVLRSVDPTRFMLAILLGLVSTGCYGLAFSQLIKKHAVAAGVKEVVGAFMLSQPGKYVPGKIWSAAMQAAALSGRASLSATGISNIELSLFGILQMTALGLACALWPTNIPAAICVVAAGVGTSASLFALPTAAWASRLPERVLRILRIKPGAQSTSRSGPLTLIIISAACLAANLAASWCMVTSFGHGLSHPDQTRILSSLYLGFAASILAIAVPAGVGVREVAAVAVGAFIAPEVSPSILAAAALVARLWQIAVDASSLLAGALVLR